jgi:hypothetical protein
LSAAASFPIQQRLIDRNWIKLRRNKLNGLRRHEKGT